MTTATPTPETNPQQQAIEPDLLSAWLRDGQTLLIDVREDFEHAEERIPGSTLHALSKFDADRIRTEAADRRVVFHCRSGKRSGEALAKYAAAGGSAFHLAGGIEAWKAAGLQIRRPEGRSRLPVMRQVQIVAGSLVLLGVVLGMLVSPWFLIISGFVGAGLTFAGISGWCGMAMLLGRMPWNRVNAPAQPAPGSGASRSA